MNVTPGLIVGLVWMVAGFIISLQTKELAHVIVTFGGGIVCIIVVDWFWARLRGY